MRKFILLISIISAFACEKEIQIKLPEAESLLVINSLFTQDSTWKVSVSKGFDIANNPYSINYQILRESVVEIRDSANNRIEILVPEPQPTGISSKFDFYFRGVTKPLPGKTYRIRILYMGIEYQAESKTPSKVNIISVKLDSVNQKPHRGSITFADPLNQKNYYKLKVLQYSYMGSVSNEAGMIDFYGDFTVTIKPFNPAFNVAEFEEEIYFTDEYFNGQELALDFAIGSYRTSIKTDPMRYVLESITPEYYLYLTTTRLQKDRADDPFAQPVQVFSNVNNGVGIFTGYSVSERSTK